MVKTEEEASHGILSILDILKGHESRTSHIILCRWQQMSKVVFKACLILMRNLSGDVKVACGHQVFCRPVLSLYQMSPKKSFSGF